MDKETLGFECVREGEVGRVALWGLLAWEKRALRVNFEDIKLYEKLGLFGFLNSMTLE